MWLFSCLAKHNHQGVLQVFPSVLCMAWEGVGCRKYMDSRTPDEACDRQGALPDVELYSAWVAWQCIGSAFWCIACTGMSRSQTYVGQLVHAGCFVCMAMLQERVQHLAKERRAGMLSHQHGGWQPSLPNALRCPDKVTSWGRGCNLA